MQLQINLNNAEKTYGKDSKPYKTVQDIITQFKAQHEARPILSHNLPSFENLAIRPKK
jgi:hypothetical protein